MVYSLKTRINECARCKADTVHKYCQDCRRNVEQRRRKIIADRAPPVYGPAHASWFAPRNIQT